MICDLLAKAQANDNDALLELIDLFQPLLRKYARKLNYDDAYEDCVLFFIELTRSINLYRLHGQMDEVAAAYIKTSVINFYNKRIQKVKEYKKEIMLSELSQEQNYYIEAKAAIQDETDIFTELGIDDMLNENEKKIIYLVYFKGYTTAEIARVYHKSRQTVNQLKHRALKKLKRTIYIV